MITDTCVRLFFSKAFWLVFKMLNVTDKNPQSFDRHCALLKMPLKELITISRSALEKQTAAHYESLMWVYFNVRFLYDSLILDVI